MRGVCRATKRDGSPCTAPVTGSNGYCWAHDPANAEKRRRIASRGGSSKGGASEISDLKAQLSKLASDVLSGKVERGDAAVVNQILNTRARLIEIERKLKEQEVLEERMEAIESVLKIRSSEAR